MVPADFITKGIFGICDVSNGERNKKIDDRIKSEILATGLVRYVERYPKLFDQMIRILEEGDRNKAVALKTLLGSLDPLDKITTK